MAMPQGRVSVRKNPNPNGPAPRRTHLWSFGDQQPGTTMAKLKDIVLASDLIDRLENESSEARASNKFTEDGLRDHVLNFAATKVAPALYRNRQKLAAAKQEAAAQREKLALKVDKSDSYAFARRQRKLDLLLQMSEKDRHAVVERVDALDPDLAIAIVELDVPAQMLGLSAAVCNLIKERLLREQHGEAVDRLAELETAIKAAEENNEARLAEVMQMTGVYDPAKFAELAKPHVQEAPWLRKYGDVVHVVDLDSRIARVATPEEAASGVYYKDFAEYQRARTG